MAVLRKKIKKESKLPLKVAINQSPFNYILIAYQVPQTIRPPPMLATQKQLTVPIGRFIGQKMYSKSRTKNDI